MGREVESGRKKDEGTEGDLSHLHSNQTTNVVSGAMFISF